MFETPNGSIILRLFYIRILLLLNKFLLVKLAGVLYFLLLTSYFLLLTSYFLLL